MKTVGRVRYGLLLAVIFLVLGFGINLIQSVETSAGAWDGRNWKWTSNGTQYYSQSYFEARYLWSMEGAYGYYAAVIPTSNLYRSGTNAIPNYIDTVDEFVNYLRALNRTTGTGLVARWKRAGSAFVAHTMLGRSGDQANANGGRSVSDAAFEDLRGRMNAAKSINWSVAASTDGINTQAANGYDVDVQAAHQSKSDVAIVVTDANDRTYKIFRKCANPVGAMSGLANRNFNLTPVMTGTPSTSEGSSTVTLQPSVNNTPGTTASDNTNWQITDFVVNPGGTYPTGVTANNSSPETHYGNTFLRRGVGTANFPRNTHLFNPRTRTIGEYPAGTRICYGLSVRPYSHTSSASTWRHSIPFCVTIGKQPKVQVLGGDLLVGRAPSGTSGTVAPASIQTAVTNKGTGSSARVFGSWGEYAAAATGSVADFGSGAAYSQPRSTATACGTSLLTFANSINTAPCGSSTTLGGFSTNRSLPDVASAFITSSSTPALSGSFSLSGLDGLYRATGNLTITGGAIDRGQSVIINAPGRTVTIRGNITYDGRPISSIEDIPQVVIIAQNIRIRGVSAATAVSRIDAWLIARGTLNTCYDASTITTLTINRCATRLTVNGPVTANTLQLWRTAGAEAGDAAGAPAEVFNLRPDAYLWGVYQASSSGRLQSVYERELPPRF
jgi:hypothetical protein